MADVPLRDAAQAPDVCPKRDWQVHCPCWTKQVGPCCACDAEPSALRAALAAADTAPTVQWATLADLRSRPDLERIECQNVTSGRWWPAWDARWDGCVIQVPWRLAAADGTTPTQPDEVPPDLGHAIFVERRDPDGRWSPVVRFVDHEAPRAGALEYRVVPSPPSTEGTGG